MSAQASRLPLTRITRARTKPITPAPTSPNASRWQQGREREPILDFIEAGLADWFVKHINARDHITARFLTLGHARPRGEAHE